MSEQIWYIYQNEQQLGPFAGDQVKQLFESGMIVSDAYVFKVGWKDWHPIEENYPELGITPAQSQESSEEDKAKRREGAPRATISGRIVIHNNGKVTIGSGANISSTGIFIETKDKLFEMGEELKLSVKVDGDIKPFNVTAKVIRYNSEGSNPIGYGVQFLDLPQDVSLAIQELVGTKSGKLDATQKSNSVVS